LGDSEKARVKHTPGKISLRAATDPCCAPSVGDLRSKPSEFGEDDCEILSSLGGQKAKDVLDAKPIGRALINDSAEFVEESTPLSSQATTLSRHAGEVLAGETSNNDICSGEVVGANFSHIVKSGNVGPVALKHGTSVPVDFDLGDTAESRSLKAEVGSSDSGEQADESGVVTYLSHLPGARHKTGHNGRSCIPR